MDPTTLLGVLGLIVAIFTLLAACPPSAWDAVAACVRSAVTPPSRHAHGGGPAPPLGAPPPAAPAPLPPAPAPASSGPDDARGDALVAATSPPRARAVAGGGAAGAGVGTRSATRSGRLASAPA